MEIKIHYNENGKNLQTLLEEFIVSYYQKCNS